MPNGSRYTHGFTGAYLNQGVQTELIGAEKGVHEFDWLGIETASSTRLI